MIMALTSFTRVKSGRLLPISLLSDRRERPKVKGIGVPRGNPPTPPFRLRACKSRGGSRAAPTTAPLRAHPVWSRHAACMYVGGPLRFSTARKNHALGEATSISESIRKERATRKNSQLAAARRGPWPPGKQEQAASRQFRTVEFDSSHSCSLAPHSGGLCFPCLELPRILGIGPYAASMHIPIALDLSARLFCPWLRTRSGVCVLPTKPGPPSAALHCWRPYLW